MYYVSGLSVYFFSFVFFLVLYFCFASRNEVTGAGDNVKIHSRTFFLPYEGTKHVQKAFKYEILDPLNQSPGI